MDCYILFSQQEVEYSVFIKSVALATYWLQSNMLKIDDFLRRYVMSQGWKVKQMLVLEFSNTSQVGETKIGNEKNHDEEAGDDALQVEPVLENQTSGDRMIGLDKPVIHHTLLTATLC